MPRLLILIAGSLILLLAAACGGSSDGDPTPPEFTGPLPTATDAPPPPSETLPPLPTESTVTDLGQALVIRVIDGDTVEIEGGARVRYIGMDTPEDTSVKECFGEEATRRNTELVEGRLVELERDISDTDRFGRLLRYVWVDGEMVNEVLIAEGLASVSTFPPDVRYVERFLGVEEQARSVGLGLWSACTEGQGTLPVVPGGNG